MQSEMNETIVFRSVNIQFFLGLYKGLGLI